MRLQLAENGLSQATTPGTPSALDKASQIINSIQAVKSIPFVGEALTIANGLVSILNTKEKAAFEQTLKEARGEPVKWWRNEGNQGSPWEPMTQDKAAWLAARLGSAVQTVSNEMIGLRAGTGKVSKARWVKAYQTLLDEVIESQKKVGIGSAIPGAQGYAKFIPYILGGVVLLYFLNRRK